MAAFPSAGANSADNFISEIWSKKLQAKFYANTVLPQVSNTDYEGEISGQGNKVIIRTVPDVTVADYTGSISYADLTTTKVELNIDKAKSYAFKVDDVVKAQSNFDYWNAAAQDAAESMKIAVETDVFTNIVTTFTPSAVDATSTTSANILGRILDAGQTLDENNIPETGRFIILSPQYVNLLKQSDLKDASLAGDGTSMLRNGRVGMIDRFTVYMSNNLYKPASGSDANKTHTIYGHPKAMSFASQFTNTETVRLESTFGDGVRGLKVYGYKTVVPTAGGVIKFSV
tara:strand:- start:6681 stop:7541 length:861 start_codon:yes stop_codon:yes gene_type:complete